MSRLKRIYEKEHKECVRLAPGTWLVIHNGTLNEVDLEEVYSFPSYDEAVRYFEDEQGRYPDLDYYLCEVNECHFTRVKYFVEDLKKKS